LILKLDFAVVTKHDTFDTIQKKVGEIKQVIVGSNTIDASELKSSIKTKDFSAIEHWLNDQKMVQSMRKFHISNYFGCMF
jgi:uncharacterized protein YegJ (DUF2314 family)